MNDDNAESGRILDRAAEGAVLVERGRETSERIARYCEELKRWWLDWEIRKSQAWMLTDVAPPPARRTRTQELSAWHALATHLPDACFVTDREGTIKDVNSAASVLLEIAEPVLRGRRLFSFVDDSDLMQFRELLTSVREHGGVDTELSLRSASGREIRVDLVGAALEELGRVLWIAREVTSAPEAVIEARVAERTQDLADRLRAAETRLAEERAARFRIEQMSQAKDRFIAMVAHDLRTPLNAVLGWAQLLRRGLVEAGMHAQAYATIERNARTQAELVAALLDVSRMAAGKIAIQVRTVDLGELVTRVLDAVAPIAEERRVRLEGRVPTNRRLYIQADPARMRQVLMNLVTNALKFTPAGGEIRVTLDAEDGRACVQVTDTGRGIAREMLPQIFDCFRQGDGATVEESGLGLGLYIARQLVEMHHGSIAAASEGPNHGSTFTVWLPISAADSADSGTSVSLLDDEEDLDGLRILVVEDDPDTRDILRVIFQRYGADVVTAVDAASAIGVFDGFAPQVVVSDIGLPGMDGCELIRRLRGTERGAHVRALAVSGFTTKEDARRAMDAGFDAHFAKPIAAVELVRAVRARG